MLNREFAEILVCPECKNKLQQEEEQISCPVCHLAFSNQDGIVNLLVEDAEKVDLSMIDTSRKPEKEIVKKRFEMASESLEISGLSRFCTFMNYGYLPNENKQYAKFEVEKGLLNQNPIKLLFEVIGDCDITGKDVLDVGCGRGGNIATMNKYYQPKKLIGLDLTTSHIKFCVGKHRSKNMFFTIGDAEKLPFVDRSFDAVLNVESSHNYPALHQFYREVFRVLRPGGYFLYSDVLPKEKHVESEEYLKELGFTVLRNQDITSNILLSCNDIANNHLSAYGGVNNEVNEHGLKEFLSVPGSDVYQQMKVGTHQFRILNLVKSERDDFVCTNPRR